MRGMPRSGYGTEVNMPAAAQMEAGILGGKSRVIVRDILASSLVIPQLVAAQCIRRNVSTVGVSRVETSINVARFDRTLKCGGQVETLGKGSADRASAGK